MEEKKETIGPGKFVGYSYKVYDDKNGELLFEAPAEAPDVMVYGVSEDVIPGLLAVLKDLSAGDKFSVTLPPAAAFGEPAKEYLIDVPLSAFGEELPEQVKPGAILPMMTDQGFTVQGKVVEITPETVKMDFNHPFAGKTLRYEGEVQEVRDATEEELKPSHGCGCGCGHDHGGCGEGHCGHDGCGHDHDGCDHNHDGCGCH